MLLRETEAPAPRRPRGIYLNPDADAGYTVWELVDSIGEVLMEFRAKSRTVHRHSARILADVLDAHDPPADAGRLRATG